MDKGMESEKLKNMLKSPFLNLSCWLIHGLPADAFMSSMSSETQGIEKAVPEWTFGRHTL